MEAVFLSGPATKRWGVKSGLLRKKKLFLSSQKNSDTNVATKLEGGSKALVAGPL